MPRASFTAVVTAIFGLTLSAPACAVMIQFSPAQSDVALGDSVGVDIVVSGLRNSGSGAEIISAFDLDVLYDPTLLAANQVVFGAALGIPDADTFAAGFFAPGRIDFSNVSLLSNADLFALQPTDSIVLAQLLFDAVGVGAGLLTFDLFTAPGLNLVGADPFTSLAVTGIGAAQVNVSEPVSLPEPGSFALAMLGLAGLLLVRRRAIQGWAAS